MAASFTSLQSPADSKNYNVPKAKGQPPVKAGGADISKTFSVPSASGEPPHEAGGVDISKKFSATPNTKSRR